MRVLKFGGSSVATAERVRTVTEIVLSTVKEEPVLVVVSAFQGVSNKLIICAQTAASGDTNYEKLQVDIVHQHEEMIRLLGLTEKTELQVACEELFTELNEILLGIHQLKELTLGAMDLIGSFGERLSANILAAYINQQYPAQYVDSRKFIVTDNQHAGANVLFKSTNRATLKYYEDHFLNRPIIPIVTGYIGMTKEGRTTTLGRNSSDYSATIVGSALSASLIEIWTDVDGVYSADPKIVSGAFILPVLSYLEAVELSHFGGNVIHAMTLKPVIDKEIPILIKNTLNPESHGTYIVSSNSSLNNTHQWNVKSVTSVNDVILLIWKNTGTTAVAHMKERLYRALSLQNIQPLVHIEGSPNNNVYIAIKKHERDKAHKTIQHEFRLEFKHKMVALEEKPSQCIVAIVGDGMKQLPPDSAGKMFQYLGRMNIQINAIVYGASERNVCLVIDSNMRVRALNLIHQAFFSDYKCLTILMIGVGRVGSALLQHLHSQQHEIAAKKIILNICAISNSKKMISNLHGLHLENCYQELQHSDQPFSVVEFLKMIPQINSSNIALVDCTASDEIVDAYPLFIQEGVHIITPNKRANVLPYQKYTALMDQFKRHKAKLLCRANVGAGLPVLYILKDLLNCGDAIIKIEGIFSGTLSYIFNHYDGSKPFGEILKTAHSLQLTEPDPREDLSGIDVGRKLLILARYMGWEINLSDIHVENLIPESLRAGIFNEAFFDDFSNYEAPLLARLEQCKKDGKVLRYVGSINVKSHQISAKLEEIPLNHPLAIACYSDNIISYITHHYHEAPLVIRGPGAGVECTALGVYSDILELVSRLPG